MRACELAVSMAVRRIPPTLRSLELKRSNSSSSTPPPHLQALLKECTLEDVWRLKCAEGVMPVSAPDWAVLPSSMCRENGRELYVSATFANR